MRVSVFYLLTLFLLAGCQFGKDQQTKLTKKVSLLYQDDKKPFYHGVASGDPLTDRVRADSSKLLAKTLQVDLNSNTLR